VENVESVGKTMEINWSAIIVKKYFVMVQIFLTQKDVVFGNVVFTKKVM